MIGAFVKNKVGGMLLSDETPAYINVGAETVREFFSAFPEIPASSDATKNYEVKSDVVGYSYGIYNPEQRGYKTFELLFPPCTKPLCAIRSEWLEVQPNGGVEGIEHTAISPYEGLPIRSYRGFWLEDIVLKHSINTKDAQTGEYVRGSVWLVTIGGVTADFPASALDLYASGWIPGYLVDLPNTGLQLRNPQGKIKYSTSLKTPYRGKVLTSMGAASLKLETGVNYQGSTSLPWDIFLSSNMSTSAPSVPHSVVISLQGYGVVLSDRRLFKDTSELTFRQKDYYSLALPYRSAVIKIGDTYRATAVPTTVGHLYSKERSDSNFAGVIAGAIIGAFTGGIGWAVMGAALGASIFPVESYSAVDISQNTTYNEQNDELLFVERAPEGSVMKPRRYLRHYSSIYGGDIVNCGLVGTVLRNFEFGNYTVNEYTGAVYSSQFIRLHYNRPDTTPFIPGYILSVDLFNNNSSITSAKNLYERATDSANIQNTALLLLYADRAGADADYYDAVALIKDSYPNPEDRFPQMDALNEQYSRVLGENLLKTQMLEGLRPLFQSFSSSLLNMKSYIAKQEKAESEIMAAANAASREPSLANIKQLIDTIEIHLETYESLNAITRFLEYTLGYLPYIIELVNTAVLIDPSSSWQINVQAETNSAEIKEQIRKAYDDMMQFAPVDNWFKARAKELSRTVETSDKADNFLRKIEAQYALFDFVVTEFVKPEGGEIGPPDEDFIRAKTLYIKNYIYALVNEYKTNGASYELYNKLHALLAVNTHDNYGGYVSAATGDSVKIIRGIRPGVLFSTFCVPEVGQEMWVVQYRERSMEQVLDELFELESSDDLFYLGGYQTIYSPGGPFVIDTGETPEDIYNRLMDAPPDLCDILLDHFVAGACDGDYLKAVDNPASYLLSSIYFDQSGYVAVDTAQSRLFSAYRSIYALLELLHEIRSQLKDGCAIA